MALHNPVEDAQRAAFGRNPRGRQALDVARAFLESPDDDDRVPRRLSAQASPVAQQRALGQQGAIQRRQRSPGAIPPGNVVAPSPLRVFLGGSEQPNRDLLRRVMERVFARPGGRF